MSGVESLIKKGLKNDQLTWQQMHMTYLHFLQYSHLLQFANYSWIKNESFFKVDALMDIALFEQQKSTRLDKQLFCNLLWLDA